MASKRLHKSFSPVTNALLAKAGIGTTKQKRKGRVDILSPSLCDATLQRLSRSLAPHVGCIIIDINPGTGLWSSKLHDFLKPQSHILIEPALEKYSAWLQPLIDAPNSKYHLRDWDDRTAWMPESYISEGLIREDFGNTSVIDGRNNSLLVITNSTQDPLIMGSVIRRTNLNPRLNELLGDFRDKKGFQAHGLVRVLMWIHDQDKQTLLPRSINGRKKTALQMEMVCHAEEIVGGAVDRRLRDKMREEFIDIQSSERVAQEMERHDIQIPPERREGISNNSQGNKSLKRAWHRELEQLEKDFESGKLKRFPPGTPRQYTRRPRGSSDQHTAEYRRLVELQRNLRHDKIIKSRNDIMFEIQAVVDSLELDATNPDLDGLRRAKALKLFTQHNEKLNQQLDQMTAKGRDHYIFLRENRRAFTQTPPLLMWDRRACEPLIAHKSEFAPEKELALLDIQGHVPDRYPMTPEQATQFDLIMKQLFTYPSDSPLALDSLAPNATDTIVPLVPDLKDPSKGGRLDLSDLEVRALTPKMAHGITMAWDQWLSKPSVADLMSRAWGSQQDH